MKAKVPIPGIGVIVVDEDVNLPKLKIRVIDDEEFFLDKTQRALAEAGYCDVRGYRDPKEVESELAQGDVDHLIVDERLESVSDEFGLPLKGHKWLIKWFREKRPTALSAYLVTAYWGDLTREDVLELERLGIEVIKKGSEETNFFESLNQHAKTRCEEHLLPLLTERLAEALPESSDISLARGGRGASHLRSQVIELFTRWANSRQDNERKLIVLSGKTYSISDLAREIDDEQSIVGRHVFGMFIRHIGLRLNLLPLPHSGTQLQSEDGISL